MSFEASSNRDDRVRAALYRARVLTNRSPHFAPQTRREANRGFDLLDAQLGLNNINVPEAVRGSELVMRAHSSIAFALIRDRDFVDRFAAALRQLGLRGLDDRLDEVPSSVMAEPIPGPIRGRRHRDELPPEERVDANGNPLPPPPGFY